MRTDRSGYTGRPLRTGRSGCANRALGAGRSGYTGRTGRTLDTLRSSWADGTLRAGRTGGARGTTAAASRALRLDGVVALTAAVIKLCITTIKTIHKNPPYQVFASSYAVSTGFDTGI